MQVVLWFFQYRAAHAKLPTVFIELIVSMVVPGPLSNPGNVYALDFTRSGDLVSRLFVRRIIGRAKCPGVSEPCSSNGYFASVYFTHKAKPSKTTDRPADHEPTVQRGVSSQYWLRILAELNNAGELTPNYCEAISRQPSNENSLDLLQGTYGDTIASRWVAASMLVGLRRAC